jgi:hypothetical protein
METPAIPSLSSLTKGEAILTGKVFISCGMHLEEEKEAARKVQALLREKFHLDTYVAIDVQSLDDIMNITKELRSSDYYLFIDFLRLSIFAHQELALAHHLGFGGDIIALREHKEGRESPQGLLRYMQVNPASFGTTQELLEKVGTLVSNKGWKQDYSRNLVVDPSMTSSGPVLYRDQTGQSYQKSWHVKIENRRPDVAAVGAVCVLDSIALPSGDRKVCEDHGYLKWVGHHDYERTLLPKSAEQIDVFAVRHDQPGLFLLSTLDVAPRQPILIDNGKYELNYKVFARDFPLLEFTIIVDLQWQPATPTIWENQTEAKLKLSSSSKNCWL